MLRRVKMPAAISCSLAFWAWAGLSQMAAGAEPGAWGWLSGELRAVQQQIADLEAALSKLPAMPVPLPHEHAGFHSGFAPGPDSPRWVQVDLGASLPVDAVVVVPAVLGTAEAHGFPLSFRVDASDDPEFGEAVTLLNATSEGVAPRVAPWHAKVSQVRARYVRVTATRLPAQRPPGKRHLFCLGELLVFSGGRNVALRATVTAPNTVETLPAWSPRHLVDGFTPLGLPVVADAVVGNGWHSGIATRPDDEKWVRVDLGEELPLDELRLVPARPRDYPERFGFGFPPEFQILLGGEPLPIPASGQAPGEVVVFDTAGRGFANPGENAVAFPLNGRRARTVRVVARRLWERSGDYVFALAELAVVSGGRQVAAGAAVDSLDDTVTPAWDRSRLVDGRSSGGELLSEESWLAGLSQRRELEAHLSTLQPALASALATARRRGVYLGGALLFGVAGGGVLYLRRQRRVRERTVQELRENISRDLHDEIGSHLGSIRLMAEMALRGGEAAEVREVLEEIQRLSREAAESMRGIIWLVREGGSPSLARLVEALQQSAAVLLKGLDWDLDLRAAGGKEAAGAATASLEFHRQVFLLFREAAHNIARHAQASRVRCSLELVGSRVRLAVEDDGRGFDPASENVGAGLANMRHRAGRLGGTLRVESAPGAGCRVILDVPLMAGSEGKGGLLR